MDDVQSEVWYRLYASALVELDPKQLIERADCAEAAIQDRLRDLRYDNDHHEERQLIGDAQRALAFLRQPMKDLIRTPPDLISEPLPGHPRNGTSGFKGPRTRRQMVAGEQVSTPVCTKGTLENANAKDTTVISLSFEKALLPRREAALRSVGYNVFSTTSEGCVRFEIQMGQCGVLLLCYTLPAAVRRDVAELFAKHCEGGVIVFVMQPGRREECPHSDICILDSDFPEKLHLIRNFRASNIQSSSNPFISAIPSASTLS